MRSWLMRLLRADRLERELDAELRDHVERQIADEVRRGLSEAEARRRVRLALGGIDQAKEACREARGTLWLEQIGRDAAYALRQVRRQPLFWGTVLATLIGGIAATTVTFAIVNGVVLRPLPYPDAATLVDLAGVGYKGEFIHLRDRARTLTTGAYKNPSPVTLTGDGEPVRLDAAAATSELFDVLRVEAGHGRRFRPADTAPGAEPVVLLSDGYWRRRFAADPAVVGRALHLDGIAHTVVGVMPRGFDQPAGAEVWRPLTINPADPIDMWARNARTIGRLRPGASIAEAHVEVRRIVSALRPLFPWRMPADYGTSVNVRPLRDALVGEARPMLLVLLAAVSMVLLVLAVNVANLLLTRGLSRERELATRAAIGATRGRLVQQLVVESVTVALVAGALGLALAAGLIRMVAAWLPADVPRAAEIGLDIPVVLFALGISLATGTFFGVVPAIRASARSGVAAPLRGVGSGRLQARERRLGRVLAAAELALAVVLVVSAALLARSLANLMAVDPGFRPAQLVTTTVTPPPGRYAEPDRLRQLAADLTARLRDLPGARAASVASAMPFAPGVNGSVFRIEGRPDPATESGDWPGADVRAAVDAGFFGVLGTPVLEGRGFAATDATGAPLVAVISRALARRYWGGASPIGARIRFPGAAAPWITIVGVVGDVKWQQLGTEPSPFFGGTAEWLGSLFVPLAQSDARTLHIVVRTQGDPVGVAAQIRDVVRDVEPDAPMGEIVTGDALVAASAVRPRFLARLLGGFAVVALLLGATGVYGVLAYSVSRRTQEFAVRLAVGGRSTDILRTVVGEGLRLSAVGVGVGLAVAFAATRWLSQLLFGVAPADPAIFAGVAVALLGVCLLASYLPARRAMGVDPITALQGD